MINPGNLEAFANKGPSPADSDTYEDDPDAVEHGEGGGEPKDFSALVGALTEYAEDAEACCDEMDPGLLTDVEAEMAEDDQQILQDGYDNLDVKVQKVMQDLLPGITADEASGVATTLEDAGVLEDADRVSGWLQRVAQLLSGSVPSEGDEDEGDDADDTDEGDEAAA